MPGPRTRAAASAFKAPPTPRPRPGKAPAPPRPPPRALRGADAAQLSLVAAYDDLARNAAVLNDGSAEKEFSKFIGHSREWRKRWLYTESERQRLTALCAEKDNELSAKEYKIRQARKLLEDERRVRIAAEADRDAFARQLNNLKDMILQDVGKPFDNATLERVRHIDTTVRRSPSKHSPMPPAAARMMEAVEESAESLLDVSDMSFDETGDLLGDSRRPMNVTGGANKRRSSHRFEAAQKRRKSKSIGTKLEGDEMLKATTKLTVDGHGNAHAESILEAIPASDAKKLKRAVRKSRESRGEAAHLAAAAANERRVTYNDKVQYKRDFEPSAPPQECRDDATKCWNKAVNSPAPPTTPGTGVRRHFSNASSVPNRPHYFVEKKVVVKEVCGVCHARIGFRKIHYKCRDCGISSHIECRSNVPLPCVAASSTRTPTNKTHANMLADFAPAQPPMVPAVLIHCVKEIEDRGLHEVGIYRVPGSESEAMELLDRFIKSSAKGSAAPALNRHDIHAVASCVKKFLRSLKEPVIPHSLWRTFVDAANNPDTTDAETALFQAVSELPRPNRDTLAFLILHLQRVADSPDCMMPADNLAKVMGPTIVGYSSSDPMAIMSEAEVQKAVMRGLISISDNYWGSFLEYKPENLFAKFGTPEAEVPFHRPTAPPSTGGIAKRTRSRQFARKPPTGYFQSPMLK